MQLTQHEMQDIKERIASMKPGYYEVRDIFGDDWSMIKSPTSFGKKFKKSVSMNLISNVKIVRTKTDNHKFYSINFK